MQRTFVSHTQVIKSYWKVFFLHCPDIIQNFRAIYEGKNIFHLGLEMGNLNIKSVDEFGV